MVWNMKIMNKNIITFTLFIYLILLFFLGTLYVTPRLKFSLPSFLKFIQQILIFRGDTEYEVWLLNNRTVQAERTLAPYGRKQIHF